MEWGDDLCDEEFEDQVFGMQTLYEIPEEKYRWLTTDDVRVDEDVMPEDSVSSETEFALERYLEDFIVSNFQTIFQGKLVLFGDPIEGPVGQQYQTEVGIIDILAQDVETNDFLVIELKKGRQSDKVVGQVLRYMGWVSENLCEAGEEVRGMIICKESDSRHTYALKMVKTVSVKYYCVNFRLQDDPPQ